MNDKKEVIVQKFFDKTSSIYSQYFDKQNKSGKTYNFNKRLDIISSMSANLSGSVLDCAVGDGQITAQIIKFGKFSRVVLVDISEKMLELARENCQSVVENDLVLETVHADVYDFLESDRADTYDLIICSGLIAHISDAPRLLQLMHKVLSPNGKIILQSTLLDNPVTAIVKYLTEKSYYAKNGYMIKYYRHKDLLQLCDLANLEIESYRKFSMGLQFLDNRLPPKLNYFLEIFLESIARFVGSEAIYLLGNKMV
ncbi:MAG: class I SAM-dependent methyltransferase [Pseudanabaenaceae cyanobacterium bins.39]|jgi:ubiquinone/menaquinone biosynthesis C-methylase UbiE|uniref:Class I SAM-dependent methyltransferase n=1 Tax=Pseudanabaena cinerea FACHB-1277 TaxID=2949581 RepID=A0A926Z644_9CYAN|nr:class I SAM-dependent methyltransferase [Pseudanabaena cinerea]MBD2150290.1 class I SAM-dependent methyltransferase [Pseudanabaena cinerea FACHB-1277]MDX2256928.1 class I SAM-dependent methyltransferase [Pseudanabaenaceae cyanobacterium bins.39]